MSNNRTPSTRQIIGALLIAIPIAAFIVAMGIAAGWMPLLLGLGIPAATCACIIGGVVLMTGGGRE